MYREIDMKIRRFYLITVLVACIATSSCIRSVESTSQKLDKAKLQLKAIYENGEYST